jgi:hypothetical protein
LITHRRFAVTHDPGERHLSPEELAKREGVPLATVYVWNRLGTGPRYMRLGKHARYKIADVIAWEDARYAGRGVSA